MKLKIVIWNWWDQCRNSVGKWEASLANEKQVDDRRWIWKDSWCHHQHCWHYQRSGGSPGTKVSPQCCICQSSNIEWGTSVEDIQKWQVSTWCGCKGRWLSWLAQEIKLWPTEGTLQVLCSSLCDGSPATSGWISPSSLQSSENLMTPLSLSQKTIFDIEEFWGFIIRFP